MCIQHTCEPFLKGDCASENLPLWPEKKFTYMTPVSTFCGKYALIHVLRKAIGLVQVKNPGPYDPVP